LSDTFKLNSCGRYFWNSIIYDKNGTYTQVLKNAAQCDSIVTVDLTIGLNRAVKIENGINYTSLADSVQYQWYRCQPWRLITGQTDKYFTTTTKGSYAVVIMRERDRCTDTSDCIALYSSGALDMDNQVVSLFPNPILDVLTVNLNRTYKTIGVKIFDITGRLIGESNFSDKNMFDLNLKPYASGLYYLQVNLDHKIQYYNILKE
jgi:hypothetical protein